MGDNENFWTWVVIIMCAGGAGGLFYPGWLIGGDIGGIFSLLIGTLIIIIIGYFYYTEAGERKRQDWIAEREARSQHLVAEEIELTHSLNLPAELNAEEEREITSKFRK